MFERNHQPLLPRSAFLRRVGRSGLVSGLVVGGSLGIGVLGYHFIADLEWIDALLNASMILTGMGPVAPLHTPGAKVFASVYALFSGVVFLASLSFFIAPIAHRVLHRLHIEADQEEQGQGQKHDQDRDRDRDDPDDNGGSATSGERKSNKPPRRSGRS